MARRLSVAAPHPYGWGSRLNNPYEVVPERRDELRLPLDEVRAAWEGTLPALFGRPGAGHHLTGR